jgi:hypothetical protein
MATNPGPRAPYRDEPRNIYREPRSSFSDNASVFWTIVAAALAAVLLIWLFTTQRSHTGLHRCERGPVRSDAAGYATRAEARTRSVSSSLESDSAGRCLTPSRTGARNARRMWVSVRPRPRDVGAIGERP